MKNICKNRDRTSRHEDLQQDRQKDLMMDRMNLKHTNRLSERLKDRKEDRNLQMATTNIIVTTTSQSVKDIMYNIYILVKIFGTLL